jgi:hypothetical protein
VFAGGILGGVPFEPGVFGVPDFDGVGLADAAFGEAVLEEAVGGGGVSNELASEEVALADAVFVAAELELELVAAALTTAGLAGVELAAGLESLVDLLSVVDLLLSGVATSGGTVTGAGVLLGASSGIDGAVAGAGVGAVAGSANGSSARKIASKETVRTSARPTAIAQRRARDARTVDASTGKKSIEVGPACSDALRNTSRLSSRSSVARVSGVVGGG